MNTQHAIDGQQEMQEHFVADVMHRVSAPANSAVVGRTQRVVRARMRDAQTQKRTLRAVLLPLAFCSAMIVLIVHSAWQMLLQFGSSTSLAGMLTDSVGSLPENSMTLVLLSLWFLPLSMGVMVMIWFRRSRRS